MKIKIKRFDKTLPLPEAEEFEHGTGQEYDKSMVAAFDFYCRESVVIPPHQINLVPINNAIAVPRDHFLLLSARSSTSWKKGLMLANGVGIIDPFYSGDKDEIRIQLYNITDKPVTIEKGEALAQGVIVKRESVEWIEVEAMGADGHGGYVTDIDNGNSGE
jgi:deoxyuridine 5'-triphosphate nucleotidohydrolase